MKIQDKKRLMKLMSFLVMSDGCVSYNRGLGNATFSFSQTDDHKDYVDYVGGIVSNITSYKVYADNRDFPRKNLLKLYTPVHPYFNTLHDRIYVDSYKSVDPHALKLLDFEALAIMYMGDGCLGKTKRPDGQNSYSTTISMCRLSYGDQLLVKQAIRDNLGIEFNVVKTGRKYHTLRLRSKDAQKFFDGIRPFVLPSFSYKMDFRTNDPEKSGGDIV